MIPLSFRGAHRIIGTASPMIEKAARQRRSILQPSCRYVNRKLPLSERLGQPEIATSTLLMRLPSRTPKSCSSNVVAERHRKEVVHVCSCWVINEPTPAGAPAHVLPAVLRTARGSIGRRLQRSTGRTKPQAIQLKVMLRGSEGKDERSELPRWDGCQKELRLSTPSREPPCRLTLK